MRRLDLHDRVVVITGGGRGLGLAVARAFPCDVRDAVQVDTLVGMVHHEYGCIDVVVNNAGVIHVGPLDTLTLDDFTEAMETHFWGPLYVMAAVLPEMRARGEGRVVNVSSIGGIVPAPHLVPYDASKFALRGLSREPSGARFTGSAKVAAGDLLRRLE